MRPAESGGFMLRYSIGIDYGTLSARALLLNVETGEEIACSVFVYPHKIMDTQIPCGKKLPTDWALQHPQDYIDALAHAIPELLQKTGVSPTEVIGVGIDFTSCTILPVTADGVPLCFLPEFEEEPHAYVKLWKHHAAQYCADQLNKLADERNEPWIKLYGGKISSEWLVPKSMQIFKEAPNVYHAADKILEAGDWVVWQLCGKEVRSACNAGYKALWQHDVGYPSTDFFRSLEPGMEHFVQEKLSQDIHPLGSCAGMLTADMAKKTGLLEGTPIAVEIIDAHASVPACKINSPGKMLMIMGTSTCHMLLSEHGTSIPGTCGIVKDGILPGYYGYEAGQSCVGDHFSWFIENMLPGDYHKEAKDKSMNIHELLREKASRLRPGESGLIALDWWNGVRSVLMDFDLSGVLIGMTLTTKPEEIYRALIEATAYGTRTIIEAFEKGGAEVTEIYAAGSIADRDPMAMQIYADVCNREIKISGSGQSGALGSAILGALAAGTEACGYSSVEAAISALGKVKEITYSPVLESAFVYHQLYSEYCQLSQYFGEGGNDVMKRLKRLKTSVVTQNLPL